MNIHIQHTTERLALTAPEVAEALGISVRHVWSLTARGQLPQPIRLGRSVRWPVDAVRDWLRTGSQPSASDRSEGHI